jgi:hypothetical protein
VKPRELDSKLEGKFDLKGRSCSGYRSYELWSEEGILELPRLLRLPSGESGGATALVIGSWARNLGLTEDEFKTALACHIRKECLKLAIACFCSTAPTLLRLTSRHGWSETDHPLADTVARLLKELPGSIDNMRREERQLLLRLRRTLFDRGAQGEALRTRIVGWLG